MIITELPDRFAVYSRRGSDKSYLDRSSPRLLSLTDIFLESFFYENLFYFEMNWIDLYKSPDFHRNLPCCED